MLNYFEGIEETVCNSWSEFNHYIRQPINNIYPLYRGHADITWGLIPASARGQHVNDQILLESGSIDKPQGPARSAKIEYFKHLATGIAGVDVTKLTIEEIEALGRHNGLATSLLDWTEKPYVAAFFAFIEALNRANGGRIQHGTFVQNYMASPTEPVCIWRLIGVDPLLVPNEFEILPTLTSVNYWQKAQSGKFTRLIHKDHYDLITYFRHRNALDRLHRIVIPGSETFSALANLEDMNITYSNLFPDLKGAAIQANLENIFSIIGKS